VTPKEIVTVVSNAELIEFLSHVGGMENIKAAYEILALATHGHSYEGFRRNMPCYTCWCIVLGDPDCPTTANHEFFIPPMKNGLPDGMYVDGVFVKDMKAAVAKWESRG